MAVSLRFDRAAIGIEAPGQAAEFDELYRAQLARVRAFLRRRLPDPGLVEDVAQETFLRAYRSLDRFEPGRPVWPWLKAIASNACVDTLRKRAAAHTDETDDLDQAMTVVDHDADPHARFNVRERQRGMRDAMASMPARQRRVLTLADVEGWDVREVAAIEGTSAESAKSALKRARATFRRTYLTLADERGLLAGVPFVGGALSRLRSARARVGRAGGLSARVATTAPFMTDAVLAAMLGGALMFSQGITQPAAATGVARPTSTSVAPTASVEPPVSVRAMNGPSSSDTAPTHGRPNAGGVVQSHLVTTNYYQHGPHGHLGPTVGPVDLGVVDFSCDRSVVSAKACALMNGLPGSQ